MEGGEKRLHLGSNQQFAPVSQGEQPATLDSKPLRRGISLAQKNPLHLGKLAMHLSKMHSQNMLYWLLLELLYHKYDKSKLRKEILF